ncbi:MAG TPA: non-canonical purine NTP pyrophosphatase, RdgB/HAM1 family [Deltaproteobacteria bacterium]|nr:non-canonical purine NTP pyrophosphatase, RdgB/HAM1 family [Deltaproteobacteria bacterium]
MQVVLATWNAHKVREIREILADAPFTVVCLADLPPIPESPETGHTFAENALQKARFVAERIDGVVVADDSGLEVDALGGAPGVHSKRFTPEATHAANNHHLLERMDGKSERTARFRCCIAVVFGAEARTAQGSCEGTILTAPRGEGGFGYDPLFAPIELGGRSMAEASAAEKNAISHRGRAFRALPRLLSELGLLSG